MFRLLWQELRFRRNGIIGWGIGLSLYVAMYVGLYPSFADQLAGFDLSGMALYEAMGLSEMTSFAGYATGTFVNLAPIVLSIYAILSGSGTLAGEEDEGKLELMVTLPIPRWQIVTAKALATAVALLVAMLPTFVARETPILELAGSLVPDSLAFGARILAVSLVTAHALLGLAALHALTRSVAGRGLILAATYASIFVIGWPIVLVALLGLADSALDLRHRLAARHSPPPT